MIGFPTEGLNTGPEFPDPEPIVTDDPAPDFTPTIDVEYEDASGAIVTGPAVVDEEGLSDGTNPGSNAEQASGSLIISSPDGVSAIQIQDVNGNWIDVTNGGVVQGQYGVLVVNAAGNWTYTLTDNTLNHGNPNATGAADQVGESFGVRMFDLDGDVSPTVQLNVLVNDDGPILTEGEGAQVSAIVDEDETSDGITDGDSVTNVASGGPGALGALVNFGADGAGRVGVRRQGAAAAQPGRNAVGREAARSGDAAHAGSRDRGRRHCLVQRLVQPNGRLAEPADGLLGVTLRFVDRCADLAHRLLGAVSPLVGHGSRVVQHLHVFNYCTCAVAVHHGSEGRPRSPADAPRGAVTRPRWPRR